MEEKTPLYLTLLQVENMMTLTAAEYALDRITFVEGDNMQGKSTVIRAIYQTLVDGGVEPPPISYDADAARIYIEMNGGMVSVEDIRTRDGKRKLTVKTDGVKRPSAAAFLRSIVNGEEMMPVQFTFLGQTAEGRRKQRDIILRMIPFTLDRARLEAETGISGEGIDYDRHGLDVLVAARERVYAQRHEINVRATQMEKTVAELKSHLPVGFSPEVADSTSAMILSQDLSDAEQHNAAIDTTENQITICESDYQQAVARVAALEEQIEKAKGNVVAFRARGQELEKVLAAKGERIDIGPLRTAIACYEADRKALILWREMKSKHSQAEELRTEHAELNRTHALLKDDLPRRLLAECTMPVEGLTFVDDIPHVPDPAGGNGLCPVHLLSGGAALDFSVALAKTNGARTHGVRVVLIDNVEMLGAELQRHLFAMIAADTTHQYIIARRTTGPLSVVGVPAAELENHVGE